QIADTVSEDLLDGVVADREFTDYAVTKKDQRVTASGGWRDLRLDVETSLRLPKLERTPDRSARIVLPENLDAMTGLLQSLAESPGLDNVSVRVDISKDARVAFEDAGFEVDFLDLKRKSHPAYLNLCSHGS